MCMHFSDLWKFSSSPEMETTSHSMHGSTLAMCSTFNIEQGEGLENVFLFLSFLPFSFLLLFLVLVIMCSIIKTMQTFVFLGWYTTLYDWILLVHPWLVHGFFHPPLAIRSCFKISLLFHVLLWVLRRFFNFYNKYSPVGNCRDVLLIRFWGPGGVIFAF